MKLKYYLRGLGTGIAVAALIIAISAGKNGGNTMTDEEILARAKELGLVERTVLSDMAKNDESDENTEENTQESVAEDTDERIEDIDNEADTEDADEEALAEVEEDSTVEAEQEVEGNEDATEITEESDAVTDDPEEAGKNNNNKTDSGGNGFGMPDEAGTVTIVVKSGASSDSVSRQLEDAGLVDSASAYDKYLCQNGYDKSIRVGTYEISADATGEEIAKMITGR